MTTTENIGGCPEGNTKATPAIAILSKRPTEAFAYLTDGLNIGEYRRFTSDAYMPLMIERLTANRYQIAVYFEENGDICYDPSMIFDVTDEGVAVVAYHSWMGITVREPSENIAFATGFLIELANRFRHGVYVPVTDDESAQGESPEMPNVKKDSGRDG